MKNREIRSPLAVLTGIALAFSAFVAQPVSGSANANANAGVEPLRVGVLNGDFAAPLVEEDKGQKWQSPLVGWTGEGGVYGRTLAAHPSGLQAASLNWSGAGAIGTTLKAVREGAKVTVRWDDSSSTYASCTAAQLAGGQRYTVSVEGGDAAEKPVTTKPGQVGGAAWTRDRTFTFLATRDAPRVVFTSQEKGAHVSCGPLMTDVRAEQVPKAAATDPCAKQDEGAPPNPACTDQAANKDAINQCPASSRDCLQSVAGDGAEEKQGISDQKTTQDKFSKTERETKPDAARQELCGTGISGRLTPDDVVVPPGDWWFC
ncbi:hypothetical protein [Streptomyces purpureus]|uniref:DUF642 domain-containing protein n=1 Tax=Streptomyces purpureus TaxID=1951 RepID=A0A918GXM5_9ACTN|nr:hypothetical protein [Streptomyces purpureus]GGT18058.1 hypothetical protein GCM10014713_08580 [Streptomyces purpureus]